jgi:hypothetical protein
MFGESASTILLLVRTAYSCFVIMGLLDGLHFSTLLFQMTHSHDSSGRSLASTLDRIHYVGGSVGRLEYTSWK